MDRSLKLVAVVLITFISSCSLNPTKTDNSYHQHTFFDNRLVVITDEAELTLSALAKGVIEADYLPKGSSKEKQLPSFAVKPGLQPLKSRLEERQDQLIFIAPGIKAVIQKSPFSISYYRDDEKVLAEQDGFFLKQKQRGFNFALTDDEKLLGTGERILGMDRRGYRLPLDNKPNYGYSDYSEQMYFSVPAVLSSKKYMLVFDNSAKGTADLGKTEANVLKFSAPAGRTSYLVITGGTYPEILKNYVSVSGRQPLPPRWTLGNFASRFGYRSERETRKVVKKFQDEDFPLDAVVLDLFWFGPDIKGHMGNLDWDTHAFPNPEQMIADFKQQGINTVLVTEPFILSSSKRWDEAVKNDVLAKDQYGEPKRFDFYFGNSGIIDIFDESAADWFWQIYAGLLDQGVAGLWGDLGEPEAHPDDTIHTLDSRLSSGLELHNVYGHKWAEVLFQHHEQDYPEKRPFIMMRSGFAGSQRYGMIPWTGDVSRSWEGLQSQTELMLQMGLMGMGYTHSDLGGFAGGEQFDKELYIRWLQFGIFQPVFRPHGQEHIASEPVFHDEETKDIIREYIRLRYRLMPYNYTLAYENSTSGMPLARPLFYEDETDISLIDNDKAFLWGNAFLVSPVTKPDTRIQTVDLPKGIWFDYWNETRYQGSRTVDIPVTLKTIPVLIKAGSFVPMVSDFDTTAQYSSEDLSLHYYADASVKTASGMMYEDDGLTHRALEKGTYELLSFDARQNNNSLQFQLTRQAKAYKGMPKERQLNLIVHNWQTAVESIKLDGKPIAALTNREQAEATRGFRYDNKAGQLHIRFLWSQPNISLQIN